MQGDFITRQTSDNRIARAGAVAILWILGWLTAVVSVICHFSDACCKKDRHNRREFEKQVKRELALLQKLSLASVSHELIRSEGQAHLIDLLEPKFTH